MAKKVKQVKKVKKAKKVNLKAKVKEQQVKESDCEQEAAKESEAEYFFGEQDSKSLYGSRLRK